MAMSSQCIKTMYDLYGIDYAPIEGEEFEVYKARLIAQFHALPVAIQARAKETLEMFALLARPINIPICSIVSIRQQ